MELGVSGKPSWKSTQIVSSLIVNDSDYPVLIISMYITIKRMDVQNGTWKSEGDTRIGSATDR